jgi:hypothetical protein
MQTSIIVILLICIILAAEGCYAGFIRPIRVFAWMAQAGFIFMTFGMIPCLIIALWLQSGAKERLARTGFVPHPSIKESVGIATGIGKNPTWTFKTEESDKSIADFYRLEKNRKGWKLANNRSLMMIFEKDKKKMVIGVHKGWTSNTLIYMLTEETSPTNR